MLTADELVTLKEILDLKPLEFVTQKCSIENYITVSKIILGALWVLEHETNDGVVNEIEGSYLDRIGEMIRPIRVDPISIATVLDFRFKTVHFRNAQAQTDATYLLSDMINKFDEFDDE